MPRKSAEALASASLSLITNLPGQRAEPPKHLKAAPATVWRSIVATKPHDWFTADTCYLLEAYCHAVVSHRLLSVAVAKYDSELADADIGKYDTLTKMQERQARVMATIATKLRLTNQSRYTPQAAATASKRIRGARPWDES